MSLRIPACRGSAEVLLALQSRPVSMCSYGRGSRTMHMKGLARLKGRRKLLGTWPGPLPASTCHHSSERFVSRTVTTWSLRTGIAVS